jgi:hypothetical protein
MKKITLSLFSLVVLAVSTQMTAQTVDATAEYNQNPAPVTNEIINPATNYLSAGGVIYSNGPYFNVPAGGPGGADLSLVENTTLGANVFGFAASASGGFRIADDWVLTDAVEVTSVDFYVYQTGSSTTSSINYISLRVWDGDPSNPASNVIYGDDAINALTSTEWSGAYRALETDSQGTTRPIMRNTVETPGLTLTPGTYWFDWDSGGTLGSGPWAPPIAILGQANTGNAIQFASGAWQPLEDSGNFETQGIPFDVTGTVLSLIDNSFEGFSYYPNPTTNILNVYAKSNIENITIFNVLGQQLVNVSPDNLTSKVDLSNLSAGMYIMKATVNGNVGSFNIIKR